MIEDPPAPTRRDLIAVGCISGTLLMTELALTRIFSVMMYYHFAFLAISIALFGLSASGVFVYLARAPLGGVGTRPAAGSAVRSSTRCAPSSRCSSSCASASASTIPPRTWR